MTTATAERTYTELPLPHALHPERALYAVQGRGFKGTWPAFMRPGTEATLVNVDDPYDLPEIKPGQSVKDFVHIFEQPPAKATGRAKIRGWRLVSGCFGGITAFELPEAARLTQLKVPVTDVYLWCAGPGNNGSEHGAFLGASDPSTWADPQTPECQAIGEDNPIDPLVQRIQRAQKLYGVCPKCTTRNEVTGNLEDRPDEVRQALERRSFHQRNNP